MPHTSKKNELIRLFRDGEIESSFICSECAHPLYEGVADARGTGCLNPNCNRYPSESLRLISVSAADNSPAKEDLQGEWSRLVEHVQRCEPSALARYLHDQRRDMIRYAIKTRVNAINYFFTLADLIQVNNQVQPDGDIDDQRFFLKLFEVCYDLNQRSRFLSELEIGRYVVGELGHTFQLAYTAPYRRAQNEAGLLSTNGSKSYLEANKYDFLLTDIAPEASFTDLDKSGIIDSFWSVSLQMQSAFNVDLYTSRKFRYMFDSVDMSVLARWAFLEAHNTRTVMGLDEFQSTISDHFKQYSTINRKGTDFLRDYVSGNVLAPIFVLSPRGVLMDRLTALYFLIILNGAPERSNANIKTSNSANINRFRTVAGERFEDFARNEVWKRGFFGPPGTFKPYKKGLEYDLIARSDSRKLILLGEIKYREMPGSTFTESNLIDHELLSNTGLLAHAKRQEDRRLLFEDKPNRFEAAIGPRDKWIDYSVRSVVITKHTPLISKYKETKVQSLDDLLEEYLLIA